MIHQPPTGRTLQTMFNLQRGLVQHYIVLEDLSPFPMDLEKRTTQKHLKGFSYRLIEEMGEAFELLNHAWSAVSTNHTEEAQTYIEAYNEELADVWHFMLELMLASNVDESALETWLWKLSNHQEMLKGIITQDSLMGSLLKYAAYMNQMDNKNLLQKDRHLFIVYPESEIAEVCPQNNGGRRLSAKYVQGHAEFFWEVTYRLTVAMNCLKARDWHKEDSKVVNTIKYHESLLEAFIAFIRLMVYTGKSELGIYNSYLLKNQINHERLKNT